MPVYRHQLPSYAQPQFGPQALGGGGRRDPSRPRIPIKLIIALVLVVIPLIRYYSRSQVNPVTGETQRIALSVDQEIALGLQSAPEMAQQFGGLHADKRAQDLVKGVGQQLVAALPPEAPPYQYDFHLLADDKTVNAFALPGGQIFITAALLERLETRAQLAGVLGHEIGHVIGSHSAQQMAKGELTQGLIGAATVAGSDVGSPQMAQQVAAMVGNMMMMKYGRGDELQADKLGLRFMHGAGYDPRALIRVMEILREASGGSGGRPEFMSTHPDPGNRIDHIQQELAIMFPGGVPEGLIP